MLASVLFFFLITVFISTFSRIKTATWDKECSNFDRSDSIIMLLRSLHLKAWKRASIKQLDHSKQRDIVKQELDKGMRAAHLTFQKDSLLKLFASFCLSEMNGKYGVSGECWDSPRFFENVKFNSIGKCLLNQKMRTQGS